MTGMATSPPRAADCAGDGCHQRVSTRIAAAPAASRAMIRTKRRTSAPGYRFLAGAMAEPVTEQVLDVGDIDRIKEGSTCAGEMGKPVWGWDSLTSRG